MRVLAVTLFTLALALAALAQQPNTAGQAAATAPQQSSPPVSAAPNPDLSTASPGPESNATAADAAPQSPAADSSQNPQAPANSSSELPIATPGTPIVLPDTDPRELKEAARLFKAGVKLKDKGKLDEAFLKFERAAELAPRNVELPDRPRADSSRPGDALPEEGQPGDALTTRRSSPWPRFAGRWSTIPPTITPCNACAIPCPTIRRSAPHGMRSWEQSTPIELQPSAAHHDFSFRGDARHC